MAASAGSTPLTAQSSQTSYYLYATLFDYNPVGCNPTSNPMGGYINTFDCAPKGVPNDGTCSNNPSTSNGYWFETTASSPTTIQVNQLTVTYTFSQPIAVDTCPPTAAGTYATSGTTTWTSCNVLTGTLKDGTSYSWTYSLSPDGKTLTLSLQAPIIIQTSTSATNSGDNLGFFLNWHFTSACPARGTTAESVSITGSYNTADKSNIPITKNASGNV